MRAPATAAFGAGLVLLAGAFDVPPLFVPGVALMLLAAVAAAWVALAARGAELRRSPGPATVLEGQPYPLGFTVGRGAIPLPGGRISDPLLPAPLALGARQREAAAEVRFARRGRRRLKRPTLELQDPLLISSRRVRGGAEVDLLVLPRVEPVVAASTRGGSDDGRGGGAGGSGGAGLDAPAVDLEIDGLRPYRQGSPASRIHWPSVARRGEMLELRLVAGADRMPLVALDSSHPVSERALDAAVRAAASLCLHLARTAGSCSLLLSGEERPAVIGSGLDGWPRAHARLAMAEASRVMPSVRRAARASSVWWVTARRPEEMPRALAGLRGTSCMLVVPRELAEGPARFEVAGCRGVSIGMRRSRGAARAA